jgi:hypothetical protein
VGPARNALPPDLQLLSEKCRAGQFVNHRLWELIFFAIACNVTSSSFIARSIAAAPIDLDSSVQNRRRFVERTYRCEFGRDIHILTTFIANFY